MFLVCGLHISEIEEGRQIRPFKPEVCDVEYSTHSFILSYGNVEFLVHITILISLFLPKKISKCATFKNG